MRLERHPGHWRWTGGPVPPGARAITLGPLVILRAGAERDERLLRHELVHVRQWKELGVLGFLGRYLTAYLGWRLRGYPHWGAYRRLPLEVEAAWLARQRAGGEGLAQRTSRPLA